jgi:hypothetical protein
MRGIFNIVEVTALIKLQVFLHGRYRTNIFYKIKV